MRLSDLRDRKVKTLDGEFLGRVHEVHCDNGRIVAIVCGARSLIERLTAKDQGRRIPWEYVSSVSRKGVFVKPDPPEKPPSASRSRRGTRRPSARRSKR
jgi:sporulation protein YlmC with PRC-barrel domain